MTLEKKIPPPIVTLVFAILAYVSSLSGAKFNFHGQSLISLLLIVLGLFVIVTAFIQFKRASTTISPLKPETANTLVSNGIFGYTRNPMYLGMALILTGLCVYLGSWFGLLAIPAFIQYINKFQITPEEVALKDLFGDSFTKYCNTVRRWV